MSLATKYRPTTFDEVVGQEKITTILTKEIQTNTTKQAYLFVGKSGCSKTTCARIVANTLDSEILEIDAASNNSAEAMRTLLESVKTRPLTHKYTVVILDECFHKNTNIETTKGQKLIKDIQIGDIVKNLTGCGRVTNVFKNKVPLTNLALITLSNGQKILTTKNHLFFTQEGWVAANKLNKGDKLYDKGMSTMSQGVQNQKE